MKTKAEGVPKAFEKYKQFEVDLILSLVPTYKNVRRLARSLGRTEDAIHVIFRYAYSGRWLKEDLGQLGPHQDNILTKIAKAKRRAGITIGYQP
ncbi:MAG: hypothetical protein ACE5JU_17970 [Candidatus Binatia bacterium]